MSAFDLKTFTFNGHTLRTVLIDGKPWFVVVDAMSALGQKVHGGAHNTVKHLDPSEVRREKARTPQITRGNPTVILVSESGLYKIILRAHRRNPAAREFQDWVTKVVLPTIRTEGAYVLHEEKLETGAGRPTSLPLPIDEQFPNQPRPTTPSSAWRRGRIILFVDVTDRNRTQPNQETTP